MQGRGQRGIGGTQAARRGHIRVAGGGDEVQAAVHPVVLNVLAVQATLISEILLKLLVDVFGHRLPAGAGNTSREAVRVRAA